MQRRSSEQNQHHSEHIFTASEVAEYEYCSRSWWYEQYDPMVKDDDEDLFARMVELEQMHGSQATAVPEYQVAEQLLVRRGAFEMGRQQHLEHAQNVAEAMESDDLADLAEERVIIPDRGTQMRQLGRLAIGLLGVAVLLIVLALLFISH